MTEYEGKFAIVLTGNHSGRLAKIAHVAKVANGLNFLLNLDNQIVPLFGRNPRPSGETDDVITYDRNGDGSGLRRAKNKFFELHQKWDAETYDKFVSEYYSLFGEKPFR